jgi:hypothetical protein
MGKLLDCRAFSRSYVALTSVSLACPRFFLGTLSPVGHAHQIDDRANP